MTPFWRTHRFGVVGLALVVLGLVLLSTRCHAEEAPASTSIGSAAYIAFAGASVVDAYSTIVALRTPGLAEGNPLLGSRLRTILPVKAAATVLAMYAFKRVAAAGHPRIATIAVFAATTALNGVALHNARLVAQARR